MVTCKSAPVINNVYKSEETCVTSGDKAEASSPKDTCREVDTLEMVDMSEGNVVSKVEHTYVYHGTDRPVDDIGSEAEVSDGVFGAHLVCHVGGEGYDLEVNTKKSSVESEGKENWKV